jgi:hypothetical protein
MVQTTSQHAAETRRCLTAMRVPRATDTATLTMRVRATHAMSVSRGVVGRVDRYRGNDEATRSQSSDRRVHVRLREVPNGETGTEDIPTHNRAPKEDKTWNDARWWMNKYTLDVM